MYRTVNVALRCDATCRVVYICWSVIRVKILYHTYDLLARWFTSCAMYFLAPFLIFSRCLHAVPHNPAESTAPTTGTADLTVAGRDLNGIDPRFDVSATYDPRDVLSTYMNAARLMQREAVELFAGNTPVPFVFSLSPWNNVEIRVVAADTGATMPRKFVVWGLQVAMSLYARNRFFTRAEYRLKFDGRPVGSI